VETSSTEAGTGAESNWSVAVRIGKTPSAHAIVVIPTAAQAFQFMHAP
jgi:hypothetical protein